MRSKAKPGLAAFVCIVLVTALSTSCSDFFPSSKAIVSITISPSNGLVKPGATTNFTAQGTYGNSTTGDVTTLVTWSSSNASVATVGANTGIATGVALGNATITAKSSSTTATATLLVSNISSITISANGGATSIIAGSTLQLTAKDQSGNDITSQVTWNSDSTTVATVSSSGLVTGVAAGSANITATLGSLTSSALSISVI